MSDLVEKVATALAESNMGYRGAKPGHLHRRLAKAAIATVLRDMYEISIGEQMVRGLMTRADYGKAFIEAYASENGIDLTQGEGT